MSDQHISIDLLSWKDHLVIENRMGRDYVFDIIRKKYILLQPEELVRQLLIVWLINDQKVGRNRIQVEKELVLNGLKRRFDIIVYDRNTSPFMLIECKSPEILITQAVFDQIAVYNMVLNAPFLLVTNGMTSFLASMHHETSSYRFHPEWPEWNEK